MRAWVIVVLAIAAGVVGAWVGYWIGHALGWTTNAVWPLQVGGGDRAILLSILASFASVMAVVGLLVGRPLQRERRLLATGRQAHATVLKAWRTGLTARDAEGKTRKQLGFELEMHPEGGAAYTVHTTDLLDAATLDAFRPGVEVNVRYDPAHPTRVAVESLAGPAPA
jgi:uncharacterized membrane protein YeaQ/YmgE (transglycosylase-associated protein family)